MFRTVLAISMLAVVAPAAVKRDDYSAPASASVSATGSQPVYSPASGASSYSPSATNSFGSASYGQASAGQYSGDHSAAASTTNFQGAQPNSQGNLYYCKRFVTPCAIKARLF